MFLSDITLLTFQIPLTGTLLRNINRCKSKLQRLYVYIYNLDVRYKGSWFSSKWHLQRIIDKPEL